MTIDDYIKRKEELHYSYDDIARLSGVPKSTVQKVLGKIVTRPRYQTIKAIEDVLFDVEEERERELTKELGKLGIEYKSPEAELREECARFESNVEYTIEEYFNLPSDGNRYELIDGELVKIGTPTITHQMIAGNVFYQFQKHIRENKGGCVPLLPPLSVQISMDDDKTLLQPDLSVICDKDKLSDDRYVKGTPDFVMEVVSKTSESRDASYKYLKYLEAGVREYWIVYPDSHKVVVNLFADSQDGNIPTKIYGFDQLIPVHIYGDQLLIDLSEFA